MLPRSTKKRVSKTKRPKTIFKLPEIFDDRFLYLNYYHNANTKEYGLRPDRDAKGSSL